MKPKVNLKQFAMLRKMAFVTEEVKGMMIRTKVIPLVTELLCEAFNEEDVKAVVFIDAVPVRGNLLVTVVTNCFDPSKSSMDRFVVPYMEVVK